MNEEEGQNSINENDVWINHESNTTKPVMKRWKVQIIVHANGVFMGPIWSIFGRSCSPRTSILAQTIQWYSDSVVSLVQFAQKPTARTGRTHLSNKFLEPDQN